jgi:hypothetical protein
MLAKFVNRGQYLLALRAAARATALSFSWTHCQLLSSEGLGARVGGLVKDSDLQMPNTTEKQYTGLSDAECDCHSVLLGPGVSRAD